MERYYAILELEFPATRDEVKKAFRRLAHVHHPDKGGDAEKFKEVSNAYHVLIQHGYWDVLAKEQQKGTVVNDDYAKKSKIFFNDEGTEFWMEDAQGFVCYYWTSGKSFYDATTWQEADDSEAFKDYTGYLEHRRSILCIQCGKSFMAKYMKNKQMVVNCPKCGFEITHTFLTSHA